MRRFIALIILGCFLSSVVDTRALAADYELSYAQCLQESSQALRQHQFLKAIEYLKLAHQKAPALQYPLEKIKAIQQLIRNNRPKLSNASPSLNGYQKFSRLGKESFEKGDFKLASYYFHLSYLMLEDKKKAGEYINLLKRAQDGKIRGDYPARQLDTRPVVSIKQNTSAAITSFIENTHRNSSKESKISVLNEVVPTQKQTQGHKQTKLTLDKILPLDDLLWQSQPKTILQIDKGSFLILESKNIDRFMVITLGMIDVERLDRDHIKITPIQVGTTFVHVWDGRGRWTFNVQVKFPQLQNEAKPKIPTGEKLADPFEFTYTMDGGALYRGHDIPSSKRETLNIQQTIALKGETPYGIADGSVGYYKFKESTEATNYTVGLSGAKAMGLTDVNLRGYDAVKYFSPLTFPGQYFRGFLMEGKAAGERLGWVYLHGQDRFTYSYVSPGIVEDRRSYVEAARVTLNPNEENQYTVNYARGYGSAREAYLKNEVYSLQARHRINPVLLKGEIATNKDTLAETLSGRMDSPGRSFYAHFRDIDKDFTTITSLPSNQGEIGADLGMDLDYDILQVNSNLDFYRDRFLPNVDNPHSLNYDWNGAVTVPINDSLNFLSSAYYLDTPGELSPRRNFRWMNNLSQRYKIWADRDLTLFVGAAYHRNRLKETPISEYDRYALTTGLQIALIDHLNYFINYEYSWVDELLSNNWNNPGVFNTGVTYSKELTKRSSMNTSFYYRDEQNAVGANSFLAGEDSITGSLGFNFRPRDGSELFLDGRLRNVWAENPENPAYNEIDVRWGLRSSWELPFSWSPIGKIQGVVFKDLDADGIKSDNEPGLKGVRIRVGSKEVVSDKNGRYKIRLMAKEVLVSADLATVPSGYVLTSPAITEVKLPYQKNIDFGFTAQSGIYGIVYFDKNHDHKPDEGDEFIQKAKIILDNHIIEVSDYDGTYFFKNVSSGTHTLQIDVNSLPLEYLPLVKLSTAVEITEGTVYVFHVPLSKKNIPDN